MQPHAMIIANNSSRNIGAAAADSPQRKADTMQSTSISNATVGRSLDDSNAKP